MSEIEAWKVEVFWYSSIVGHMIGWRRTTDESDERTFRTERRAKDHAERITGVPSFLVPYMSRKGIVVKTYRKRDWIDFLTDAFHRLTHRPQSRINL